MLLRWNFAGISASILAFALGAATSRAAAISPPVNLTIGLNQTLTGTLPNQGTPLEIAFTLPQAENVTIFTSSYATGGFEPNLTLYNGSGNFVNSQALVSPIAVADPNTGVALDGYINAPNLAQGNYTVTLTDWELQQAPSATNLSDGFTFNLGSGGPDFTDEQGNTRSADYSITLNASVGGGPSAVPLPSAGWASLAMLGGLGAISIVRSKTKSRIVGIR
jgi:hypothetical protein